MRLRHILPTLLIVCLFYLLFRNLDLLQFAKNLITADWRLIVLAAFLSITLITLARVKRFAILLEPIPHRGRDPGFWDLTRLSLASRALSSVLPAKAGETLRTVELYRRHGYPAEAVVAAILVEPVIEALSMAIPAMFFVLAEFPEARRGSPLYWIAVAGMGAVFLLGLLFVWRNNREPQDLGHLGEKSRHLWMIWARLREGVHLVNSPRLWAKALGWTWLQDAVDLLTIGLCLWAVGIDLSFLNWFVILVAVNLAIALPITPGNLGTLEAGAVLILKALGVNESQALAFALFYHGVHLLPVILAGAVGLQYQFKPITR